MKKYAAILMLFVLFAPAMSWGGGEYDSVIPSMVADDMQRKAAAEEQKRPYVDNTAVIALIGRIKDSLGSLKNNGEIRDYEESANGLGYSKKYTRGSDDIYADVYSYHMGARNLPSGIGSEIFKEIYKRTIGEIKSTEGRLYSGIMKLEEKDVVIKGAGKTTIEFKKYVFEADRLGHNPVKKVKSAMFITIYGGVILKVRATYALDGVKDGDEAIGAFMSDLVNNVTAR